MLRDRDYYCNGRQKDQFGPLVHRDCNNFQEAGYFSLSDD